MNRQVPTLAKLLTMVIFSLTCFGLILWLWLDFGGSVPFKAQQYEVHTSFPEATQIATEADVRIAGVDVGHVKKVVPGADGRVQVTFALDKSYTPLPVGTKALLRSKTLLGETYVSLTPPRVATNGTIPEGGAIPPKDVGTTVELDEFFQTLDAPTRAYFQSYVQTIATGLDGEGATAGRALGELAAFTSEAKTLSDTLNTQLPALKLGLKNGKLVLDATANTPQDLTAAIVQTNRVFKQTASQSDQLTALLVRLPKFIKLANSGTADLEKFARNTGPAATKLQPSAVAAGPAFKAVGSVAPLLLQTLTGVERTNKAGVKGLPATTSTLNLLPTVLGPLAPALEQLNPIFEYAGIFSSGIATAFGNLAASTGAPDTTAATFNGQPPTAVRALANVEPESFGASQKRPATNRANPYAQPNWESTLLQGLQTYSSQTCGTATPTIPDAPGSDLDIPFSDSPFYNPASAANDPIPSLSLIDALRFSTYNALGAYASTPTATTPSAPVPTTPLAYPACNVQAQFNLQGGRLTTFPQLNAAPNSTDRSVTGG